MSAFNPVKLPRRSRGIRGHLVVCGLLLAAVPLTGCTQLRLPQSYDTTGFDGFQRPSETPPLDQPPALAASKPKPDSATASDRAIAVERAMARANSEQETAWDMEEPANMLPKEKLFDSAIEQVNYQQPIDDESANTNSDVDASEVKAAVRTLVAQTDVQPLETAPSQPIVAGERPAYVDPEAFRTRPQPLSPVRPAPLSVIPPAAIPETVDQTFRQHANRQPSPLRPRLGNDPAIDTSQTLRPDEVQVSLDRSVTQDSAGQHVAAAIHQFAAAPVPKPVPTVLQGVTRRDESDMRTEQPAIQLVSQRTPVEIVTDLPIPAELQSVENVIVEDESTSPSTLAAPVGFTIPVVDEQLNDAPAIEPYEPESTTTTIIDDSAVIVGGFVDVAPGNLIAGVTESDEEPLLEPMVSEDQFFVPAALKQADEISLPETSAEFVACPTDASVAPEHNAECGCQRCETESVPRPERFASLDNHFTAAPTPINQFSLPAIDAPVDAAAPAQSLATDTLALPAESEATGQQMVSFDAAPVIDRNRAESPSSDIPPFGVDALIAHNVVTWKSRLDDAIELADLKLANDAVDAETRASMEVSLRLLQVVRRQVENVATNDARLSAGEQQYWAHQLDALTTMLASAPADDQGSSEVQRHQSARQTLSHLREAVAQLETIANLKVSGGKFCTEITGFGQYREFDSSQFAPGDRALVYCEVENYFSQKQSTPDGNRFVTHLRGSFAVYDEQGRVVQQAEFPAVEDIALKRRRDFYLYLPVTIGDLDAGNYRLHVMVEDLDGNKTGSLEPALRFSVANDGSESRQDF